MTNGLFITEGLVTIKDKSIRTFPIVLININDCDVNLRDGTVLSTVERIVVAESHVICEALVKKLEIMSENFLKRCIAG